MIHLDHLFHHLCAHHMGVFHSPGGTRIYGWSLWTSQTKMDDLGIPLFLGIGTCRAHSWGRFTPGCRWCSGRVAFFLTVQQHGRRWMNNQNNTEEHPKTISCWSMYCDVLYISLLFAVCLSERAVSNHTIKPYQAYLYVLHSGMHAEVTLNWTMLLFHPPWTMWWKQGSWSLQALQRT